MTEWGALLDAYDAQLEALESWLASDLTAPAPDGFAIPTVGALPPALAARAATLHARARRAAGDIEAAMASRRRELAALPPARRPAGRTPLFVDTRG